jgi:hypothetical protein
MKIMVCGPIGDTGITRILKMQKFLEDSGFEIVKQFSMNNDYSHIHDFRRKQEIVKRIIDQDLKCVKRSDILVVLSKPSFGSSIEMFTGKNSGKKIILFSRKSVPSPWPIGFSDIIVTNRKELVRKLHEMM